MARNSPSIIRKNFEIIRQYNNQILRGVDIVGLGMDVRTLLKNGWAEKVSFNSYYKYRITVSPEFDIDQYLVEYKNKIMAGSLNSHWRYTHSMLYAKKKQKKLKVEVE